MDEVDWKILSLTAKRGVIGATREDFFRDIRGLRYEDLMEAVARLDKDGYIAIEWTGEDRFILTVSEKGSQLAAKEYEKRLKAYEQRIDDQRKIAKGVDKV